MTPAEKSYHHGNLRQALLRAVGDVLHAEGVGGLSLRAVARRAGVSHSAPAHHFGDRLGMLTAFAIEGFDIFRERMRQALDSQSDPQGALDQIGMTYLDFALSEPARFDVMFRSELHDKDDPDLQEAAFAAFGVLTLAVEQLCNTVEADLDAELIAIEAWSKVHGLATLWRDGALQMFVEGQDVHDLLRRVMEMPSPLTP